MWEQLMDEKSFGDRWTRDKIPAPPLPGCVALGKFPPISECVALTDPR